MTDRDRLIELIVNGIWTCDSYECKFCTKDDDACGRCYAEAIADYLLQNGVIVPPCKVGDVIYALTYSDKGYVPLKVTRLDSLVRWMGEGQFGHTLFTTREEAEKALKEREMPWRIKRS